MVVGRVFTLAVVLLIVLLTAYFVFVNPDTDLEVVSVPVGADLSVDSNFSVSEYMGTWYEVVRSPNPFERGCVCVKANYELDGDRVRVLNSCNRGGGLVEDVRGFAYLTDEPGVLEVQFLPWSSTEYRVLDVNDDYTVALVSGGDYWWVLARGDYSQDEVDEAMSLAESRGLDVDSVIEEGVCTW